MARCGLALVIALGATVLAVASEGGDLFPPLPPLPPLPTGTFAPFNPFAPPPPPPPGSGGSGSFAPFNPFAPGDGSGSAGDFIESTLDRLTNRTSLPDFLPAAASQMLSTALSRMGKTAEEAETALHQAGAEALRAARNASRAVGGRYVANATSADGERWLWMSFRPLANASARAQDMLIRLAADRFVALPALPRRFGNDSDAVVALGLLPRNPHGLPRRNETRLASDVMSLSLTDAAGVALSISGLSSDEAFNFTLPLTFVPPADGRSVATVACSWWDRVAQDWASTGCAVLSANLTNPAAAFVQCSCTHLTDFAATVSSAPAGAAAPTPQSNNAAVIGGAVGGAVAVIALVAVGVVLARNAAARRRRSALVGGQAQAQAQAQARAAHQAQARNEWVGAPV